MNRNQKAVIGLGVFLIILSWLFPFYEGEMRVAGNIFAIQPIGFYSVFSPPPVDAIKNTFVRAGHRNWSSLAFGCRVNNAFLLVQILVIALACFGLFLLFSSRRKPISIESKGSERPSFYKKD